MPLRLFVTAPVEPSDELRRPLAALCALGRAVRPVPEHQLHLTLRFLGDTDDACVPDITRSLRDAFRSQPAIDTPIAGVGAFPSVRRPSVIWAGMPGCASLVEPIRRLNESLAAARFPPPDKAHWVPHLTLARVKARPGPELLAWLASQREATFGRQRIDRVHLMKSELTRDGARHAVLATVRLEG